MFDLFGGSGLGKHDQKHDRKPVTLRQTHRGASS
jgi:hypothetical protein